MAGKEAYKIWAPAGKKWVDWVRPVPFVAINEYSKGYTLSSVAANRGVFLEATYEDAAIIVDLPGEQSVAAGIVLAKLGYRPIPIYNGTIEQQGARATVDNQSVGVALLLGAGELKSINLDDDAMPAFLLDIDCTDIRWMLLYLITAGTYIRRICRRQNICWIMEFTGLWLLAKNFQRI